MFSTDGKTLVCSDWHKIYMKKWPSDNPLSVVFTPEEGGTVEYVACDTECKHVVFAEQPPTYKKPGLFYRVIKLMDTQTSEIKVISERGMWPTISPDGRYIAYSSADTTKYVIVKADNLEEVASIERESHGWGHPSLTSDLAWSPDSERVYYRRTWDQGSNGAGIYCYNITTKKETYLYDKPLGSDMCVISKKKAQEIIKALNLKPSP